MSKIQKFLDFLDNPLEQLQPQFSLPWANFTSPPDTLQKKKEPKYFKTILRTATSWSSN